MILFLRSSDVGIDSKLRRYRRGLDAAGLDNRALYWDRDGYTETDPNPDDLRFSYTPRNSSRWLTGLALIGLNIFAFRAMWQRRKQLSLVQAVDFDTVLAALLMRLLAGTPYIYDIYDSYPDSRGVKGVARLPFDWLEKLAIRHASLVILADECRTEQHCAIADEKRMIIENVPDADQNDFAALPQNKGPASQLRIGYLGTFEPRFRGLEDCITAVEANEDIELHIAGTGALEPHIKSHAATCPRIHLYGPMDHGKGLALLASCDIILGLYYRDVANHRYAAPNKYYEHLLLGKPLLTSAGTPPGRKVREQDTGWAIADGAAPIAAVLAEALADSQSLLAKGERARLLWQNKFAGYYEQVIAGDYVGEVRKLLRNNGKRT
ncbi:glycosyltransferase [Sphingorhabdus sp.]|uniref:glycosyltransferase n=1 Tax=Sphingorhabdus sp. TaxID=1902408 RepID=UPI003BAFE53D